MPPKKKRASDKRRSEARRVRRLRMDALVAARHNHHSNQGENNGNGLVDTDDDDPPERIDQNLLDKEVTERQNNHSVAAAGPQPRRRREEIVVEDVTTEDEAENETNLTSRSGPPPIEMFPHLDEGNSEQGNDGREEDNNNNEVDDDDDLSHFEWDVEKALEVLYTNAGTRRFQETDVEGLKKAIKGEAVSLEERIAIMRKFNEAQNWKEKFYVCASCGMQSSETHYRHKLDSLVTLQYTPEQLENLRLRQSRQLLLPVNDLGNSAFFKPHDLLSYYESPHTNMVYHLHPEFVDIDPSTNEETACLCSACTKSVKKFEKPRESIANGIDFGDPDRVGLVELNEHEQAIIALVRHATRYVKIKPNVGASKSSAHKREMLEHKRVNRHVILFEHNAVHVASKEVWDAESWFGALKFMFVGPKDQMEQMVADTFETYCLLARPFAIYQWLSVLKEVNKLYRNIEIPTFQYVKDQVKILREKLRADAFKESGDASLLHEHTIGGDVAQQRHGGREDEQTDVNSPNVGNGVDAMGYSMLVNPTSLWRASTDESDARFLDAADDLFRPTMQPRPNPDRLVRRFENPMDELAEGDYGLCGAFPSVFILGRAYNRKSGPLTTYQRRHLLNQYTKSPGRCRPLLFYLFDLMQRFHTMRRMHTLNLKNDAWSMQEFKRLVDTGEIRQLLEEADGDYKCEAGKKILKLLRPITSFVGRGSYWGAFERSQGLKTGYEKTRHYGLPSGFITVGPDDINNPTAFRRTVKQASNRNVFPSVPPQDYLSHLHSGRPLKIPVRDGTGTEQSIPCDYETRARAAMNDPVAMVSEYRRLLHNTLSILLGLPPSNISPITRKTVPLAKRPKGLFGKTLSYYGVNEPQARGTLHFHIIVWGGIPPQALQRAAGNQELTDEIDKTLKTMYSSTLPKEHLCHYVAKKLLRRQYKKIPPVPAPQLNPPDFDHMSGWSEEKFDDEASKAAAARQYHEHSATCHKGPNGKYKCRMNIPKETFDCICGGDNNNIPVTECNCRYSKCKAVRLTSRFEINEQGKKVYLLPNEEINFDSPLLPPRYLRESEDLYSYLYSFRDDDMIVYELPRPRSRVANWNEIYELLSKVNPVVAKMLKEHVETLSPEEQSNLFNLFASELVDLNGSVITYNKTLSILLGSNTACYPLFSSTQLCASLSLLSPIRIFFGIPGRLLLVHLV